MGSIGAEQGKLGAEEGRLGAEQGRLEREADQKMKVLIDEEPEERQGEACGMMAIPASRLCGPNRSASLGLDSRSPGWPCHAMHPRMDRRSVGPSHMHTVHQDVPRAHAVDG